jgi:hypothetical protein
MIAGFPFVTGKPLWSGLIAFYKLSNVNDSSGNGFNLTNENSVTFGSGKIGNCAEFNESNWLYSETNHNFGSQFTAACWVYINDSTSLRPALSQWQSGFGSFFIGTADENYVFATCHDQDPLDPTWLYGGTAAIGEWVHIAGVYSGTTERLYINGVEVASQATSALVNPDLGTFKIGTLDEGGEFLFNGKIDAAGIWNRTLTPSNILALYNAGTGREI